MFLEDTITALLNGIIILCFITYNFKLRTIFTGFITGILSLFLFVTTTNPILASCLRMVLWFFVILIIIEKDEDLKINSSLKIFHVSFFLALKMLLEFLIYSVQNFYDFTLLNRNNYICIILSCVPFIIIANNYNFKNYSVKLLDNLNKKINYIKVLNNFLGTIIFIFIYFFVLLFKKGV
jgi:hypothetical protein